MSAPMAESHDGALAEPLGRARRQMLQAVGLRALVGAAGVLAALVLASVGGVALGLSDAAVGILQVGALLAALVAGFALGRRALTRADHPAELARALDAVSGLGGETGFLTVWELERDAGRFGESPELAEAARATLRARPAWNRAPEALAAAERARLKGPGVGVAALVLAALVVGQVAPSSTWHAMTAAAGLDNWRDAWRRVPPPARLADFRITYRFPDYVGRPPRAMRSASGRVRCLPGTEVRVEATALDPLRDATLLLTGPDSDAEPEEIAARAEGRTVVATFVASRPGTYRFRTTTASGEVREERRGHPIELDVDEAPRVTLLEPTDSPLEVNEKDVVRIAYRALDDFGLGEAVVRWRVLDTTREGAVTLSKDIGRSVVSDRGELDLAELELQPGDRVSYSVEVRDNDTVNGPKIGASRTQELRVYSRRDHHARVQQIQEEALDELVHILGDHLEEAFATSAIQASLPPAKQRVTRASEAEDLLEKAEEASREDPLGRPELADAFVQAREGLARRRRSSRSALRRLERSPADALANAARFVVGAEYRMVEFLEKQAVYLADLLNDQRMLDAEALAEQLRSEQEALREALEAYRDAPTPEKREALAQAIQRIQKRIRELSEQMARLQSSVPTEYVNRDALQAQHAARDLDRMQELLEAGKFDEALEQVDQMLGQTEQMLAQLREGRQELQSREYSEIAQRAEEIWRELEDLKMRQQELARRTEQIADEVRERSQAQIDASDAFIEKQLERLERAGRDIGRVKLDESRPEADAFDAIAQRVEDGKRALKAKDFGAAREVLERGRDQMKELERETDRRAAQLRRFGAMFGDAEAVERASEGLTEARPPVEAVIEDLEDMVPDPSKMLDADERAALEQMADMQSELAERAESLGQQLDELGQQLPIVGPEVGQKIADAESAMQGARERLQGHDAPSGLGEERRALESLAQLQEQLQQMGQGQQSGGGAGVPLPFGGGGRTPRGGEGDGRDIRTAERVEIPQPEEFEAPAEFRQDILEAAKQGTVESYRDAVRRYYEELVK